MIVKIGYIGGFWATNIGNSVYNLGTIYLLTKLYGKKNIYFLNDPPAHFWNENGENPKKSFDFLSHVTDVDIILVSGPVLSKRLPSVYRKIFSTLMKRGIKIGYISAGLSYYDSEEINILQNFFQEFPPYFIITRDEVSFSMLKKMNKKINLYNGICTGFYIGNAVNIIPMDISSYIVYNFARKNEPVFSINNNKINFRKRKITDSFPKTLDGNLIIRTVSEGFKYFKFLIFNRPNVYYSDLPHNYLSIYKHAKLVLSERVHTCVATLSLGGKAMYIAHSKRSLQKRRYLFDRLNLFKIYEKPISLDFNILSEEKNKLEKFLKNNI